MLKDQTTGQQAEGKVAPSCYYYITSSSHWLGSASEQVGYLAGVIDEIV